MRQRRGPGRARPTSTPRSWAKRTRCSRSESPWQVAAGGTQATGPGNNGSPVKVPGALGSGAGSIARAWDDGRRSAGSGVVLPPAVLHPPPLRASGSDAGAGVQGPRSSHRCVQLGGMDGPVPAAGRRAERLPTRLGHHVLSEVHERQPLRAGRDATVASALAWGQRAEAEPLAAPSSRRSSVGSAERRYSSRVVPAPPRCRRSREAAASPCKASGLTPA